MGVPIQQARREMCSVASKQHDAFFRIARKGGEACPIDCDLNGFETTERLLDEFAQMGFVANPGIASQAQLERDPPQRENGE